MSRANQLTSPEPITNLAIMIKVGEGYCGSSLKCFDVFVIGVNCESSEKTGTVIRFVSDSAKFSMGTVVGLNGIPIETKILTFKFPSAYFTFNKCPI